MASDQLSANEIEAASEVQLDQFNSQLMSELVAAPSFAVVRANLDQVVRAADIDAKTADKVQQAIDKAEKLVDNGETASAAGSAEQGSSQRLDELRSQATLKQALEAADRDSGASRSSALLCQPGREDLLHE